MKGLLDLAQLLAKFVAAGVGGLELAQEQLAGPVLEAVLAAREVLLVPRAQARDEAQSPLRVEHEAIPGPEQIVAPVAREALPARPLDQALDLPRVADLPRQLGQATAYGVELRPARVRHERGAGGPPLEHLGSHGRKRQLPGRTYPRATCGEKSGAMYETLTGPRKATQRQGDPLERGLARALPQSPWIEVDPRAHRPGLEPSQPPELAVNVVRADHPREHEQGPTLAAPREGIEVRRLPAGPAAQLARLPRIIETIKRESAATPALEDQLDAVEVGVPVLAVDEHDEHLTPTAAREHRVDPAARGDRAIDRRGDVEVGAGIAVQETTEDRRGVVGPGGVEGQLVLDMVRDTDDLAGPLRLLALACGPLGRRLDVAAKLRDRAPPTHREHGEQRREPEQQPPQPVRPGELL